MGSAKGSVRVRFVKGRGWLVDVSTYPDGRRKRSIKTFGPGAKAKAAAEQYKAEQDREIKTGKFWERRSTTFRGLWEKFDAHQLLPGVLAPATIADYRASARLYLLPHFGEKPLNELERDVEGVCEFRAKLLKEPGIKAAGEEGSGKPLAARTVAKILTLLGTVFRYGQDIGYVSINPTAKVDKPHAPGKEVPILTPEKIARLRDAFDRPQDRLMFELDVTTGLRSGELRGLVWDSIDLKGKRLFVKNQATRRRADDKPKTETSVRTVPIADYLIPQLKRWKLQCPVTPRGLVFPGEPDVNGEREPLAADYLLRNILRCALKKAGLPAMRIQDIRHLACTLMAEAGVPLKQAQKVMGHASEVTTLKIYTHVMDRQHHDAADKMAALAGLANAGDTGETKGAMEPQGSAISR